MAAEALTLVALTILLIVRTTLLSVFSVIVANFGNHCIDQSIYISERLSVILDVCNSLKYTICDRWVI